MAEPSVRLLTDDELAAGAKLVGRQMLGSVTDEVAQAWADVWQGNLTHGAFADKELVGVCHWFPTRLATPGEPLDAAGVTAVSVLSNHRRQGHLTRLMQTQLRHAADAGKPVAVLIAAEYPIYGRFGYGPATEACALTPRHPGAPASGTSPRARSPSSTRPSCGRRCSRRTTPAGPGPRAPCSARTPGGIAWPGSSPGPARRST